MPRSGYDLSKIPGEERPGQREGAQEAGATEQQATRSLATSSSLSLPSTTSSTPNTTSTAHSQAQAPTVRISPGYVTNTGDYAAYNSRTGRGWLAGSSRAALGSASPILAGKAARAVAPRPIAPAPALEPGLVPAPLFSPRAPGPGRPAGAPQAPTRGGLLAPPPRTPRQRSGGSGRQRVRRASTTTIAVTSPGAAAAANTSSASSSTSASASASASAGTASNQVPELVVTAPSSLDEEMTDAGGDGDVSKGKGKQKK